MWEHRGIGGDLVEEDDELSLSTLSVLLERKRGALKYFSYDF